MITLEQARCLRHGDEVHIGECRVHIGKRGGRSYFIRRWRVSGMLKEFKTTGHWYIPIKYGMYYSWSIDPHNADRFHLSSECSLRV